MNSSPAALLARTLKISRLSIKFTMKLAKKRKDNQGLQNRYDNPDIYLQPAASRGNF